jgi:hypothetical protein
MRRRTNSTDEAEKNSSSTLRMEDSQTLILANKCRAKKRLRELEQAEFCRTDPLYWLQTWTETFDEKCKEKGLQSPYRPFPRKPYFAFLFQLFQTEPRLFVPTSRDMMISWAAVGFGVWKCQFFGRQHVIVQAQKESKVAELIKGTGNPGYAATLYERQPQWLKESHPLLKPLQDMPATMMSWANGSTLRGIPQGVDQIRMFHPTLYLVDEAAFIDDFEQSYGAAIAVASQIIAVSSAAPSFFGDVCTDILERAGK